MINQLKIKNFQSHKNTTIPFKKGLNVIVGESDSGKTSILRALNLLINNRPTGDAFRSHWGGKTLVEGCFDDCVIERVKDNNENSYVLNEEQVFKAMGVNVPEEIEDLLNMSEINQQQQHSPHYLLSDSSGDVAKQLNKITKLDLIDSSLKNIESLKRKNKSELNFNKERLDTLKEEENKFDYLKQAEKLIISIEKLEAKRNKIYEEIEEITVLIDIIKEKERVVGEFKDISQAKKEVDDLLSLNNDIKDLEEERKSLKDIISGIDYYEENIKEAKEDVDKLKEEFDELIGDVCPLCNSKL